jgi:hypothetical protein
VRENILPVQYIHRQTVAEWLPARTYPFGTGGQPSICTLGHGNGNLKVSLPTVLSSFYWLNLFVLQNSPIKHTAIGLNLLLISSLLSRFGSLFYIMSGPETEAPKAYHETFFIVFDPTGLQSI